jgi:hypothetical protein
MWHRRRGDNGDHRIPPLPEIGVGDECEAFLSGKLAAYLQCRNRPVPPVGWLNQVVHGTPNELAFLASSANSYAIQPAMWRRAVGYLSQMLLERANDTGRPIEQLQQELLVPLELELMGDPSAVRLDAADVIRLTLRRLYELPELSA